MSPARLVGRRGFLGGSLAAVAGAPLVRPGEAIRLGVVGLNGRGAELLDALRTRAEARIVALCDVDDQVLTREARRLRERNAPRPSLHTDYRTLLERADVDAVVLATPNHWHALQAIWACQAGKDVYLEAPATHVFAEAQPLVAAARRYGRRVHCALPARSSPALLEALAWQQAGNLGALELARVLCHEPLPPIGKVSGNQKLPESVDYDLWCGPAPLRPLRRARLHHDWRWTWATGDGALGTGVHGLDVARWALGLDEWPASVTSLGLRAGEPDDGETPNTQLLFYAWDPAPILVEVRGLPRDRAAQAGDWAAAMDEFLGLRTGVVLHCAGGTLRIDGDARAVACDPEGREIRRWEGAGDPLAAWIEALQGRREEDPAAGIEAAARSSALVQMGNASQRLARATGKDELVEAVKSSSLLSEASARLLVHLEANAIDLAATPVALGPCLVLDRAQGCFQDPPAANELLAGSFREPFVLPQVV